jgi:hypothetical protein
MAHSWRSQKLKSVVLLLLTLWVATPAQYVHELLGHQHSYQSTDSLSVSEAGTTDCSFETFSKPLCYAVNLSFGSPEPVVTAVSGQFPDLLTHRTPVAFGLRSLRAPPTGGVPA